MKTYELKFVSGLTFKYNMTQEELKGMIKKYKICGYKVLTEEE